MSRLLWSVTLSVDGFIAGPGGDMAWMTPYLGPNPTAEALVPEIGSLLVGARTYGGGDPNAGDPEKEGAFSGAWHGPQVVLTHHLPVEPVPDTTFVDDLGQAITLACELAGDRYVNVLGADVARQCLDLGAIDEVLLFYAPVMLGDGTRLLDVAGGHQVELERIDLTHTEQATALWFRVVR